MSNRWKPSLWASLKPFGIGEGRPNNYLEIAKAIKENRKELGYAWRILNQGVCDGCALGTKGMRDWTLPEVHLCNIRLRLLSLNTMPALDPELLADVEPLRARRSKQLRELGRLPYPMLRRRGEPGFSRVTWDEALEHIAERVRATDPQRTAWYLTSRGMPNESYYAAAKAVRAMGCNSIDNAARVCHAPSTYALKAGLGVGATTCSYSDWIGSDLVVFIGSNPANNQPVAMKYLYHARKAGTKVVCINPYREPGMERYWVPSNVESALFGTKITDRFFRINAGGDVGFLNGTLKHMIEASLVDAHFIGAHTTGFEALSAALQEQSWEEFEHLAGAPRAEMTAFAEMLGAVRTCVLVWSMGVTQHAYGEDNVRAIVNLGLAKGFVGRPGCGLMPIRGHSGVQGGAEMGAYATVFPGGAAVGEQSAAVLSDRWGFKVPSSRGLVVPEMVDAAHAGDLDVLFSAGGNFLEVMPEPRYVEEALSRVGLRVHMDIVLSSQMLVNPADEVVLLPAATRYETPGGVTETSTERRIIFSPEVPGRRIGQARPEWDVLLDLARRVVPERSEALTYAGTGELRQEIARIVPLYDGIQDLTEAGDSVQYGGPHLCAGWEFPTPDGKAHFAPVPLPRTEVPDGSFVCSTRRGKQFNSMIHEDRDPITGAMRDAVYMNARDAARLGVDDGDAVTLRSAVGEYDGRVFVAPVAPGNLQIHWPAGSVLINRTTRSAESKIPDYNAVVTVETANRRGGDR
ncbi:MAG: FdhF/YdeP family oxidoreductase [Actinobacteria bacterium]|nr:FdhF/YdeP family oxidoreductase [Actinomycetota bacterium]